MKQKLSGYIIEKYSNMTGAYSCKRIQDEAKKQGISLEIIGVCDCMVTKEATLCNKKPLLPRDFIVNRYKWGDIREELNRLADRQYNENRAFSVYVNKYQQLKNLKFTGIKIPEYMLGTTGLSYDTAAELLKTPFIMKGLESAQGEEVFLIQNEEDYRKLKDSYGVLKEWLFERYISESCGRDLRFYSIRGEVAACMTREAKSGFKANVALGAGVREHPVDDTIRQVAREVYEQTKLDFLGIDLLFGKDAYYFCEINVMPGMEGIERATGINVAEKMIQTIAGDFS